MRKTTRLSLLAIVSSALLLLVSASPHEHGAIQLRSILAAEPTTVAVTSVSSSAAAASSSTQAATSAAGSSSSTANSAPSSSAVTTEAAAAATSSSAAGVTPTSAGNTQQAPTSTTRAAVVETSVVATTDSSGQVVTSIIQLTSTPPNSSPSPTSTNTSSNNDDSGGGLSTGSIVGLSVSGGIAALGIILFFVWKFTRKRFSDFDDNEAIKWPELNAHDTDVHALPTNATGRAGFGPENDSDINLTRASSPAVYANSIAASSEMYSGGDPYAVPPLPHLNPNQPYHDEPGAYGQPAGYYDPYRGPVPNTFTDTISDGHGAESIPMTQMTRGRSPGPQMSYDMQGRNSPAPQAAMGYANMDRSGTPTPAALATELGSPSPHPGYGYGPR